jgi:hypothetical protein
MSRFVQGLLQQGTLCALASPVAPLQHHQGAAPRRRRHRAVPVFPAKNFVGMVAKWVVVLEDIAAGTEPGPVPLLVPAARRAGVDAAAAALLAARIAAVRAVEVRGRGRPGLFRPACPHERAKVSTSPRAFWAPTRLPRRRTAATRTWTWPLWIVQRMAAKVAPVLVHATRWTHAATTAAGHRTARTTQWCTRATPPHARAPPLARSAG